MNKGKKMKPGKCYKIKNTNNAYVKILSKEYPKEISDKEAFSYGLDVSIYFLQIRVNEANQPVFPAAVVFFQEIITGYCNGDVVLFDENINHIDYFDRKPLEIDIDSECDDPVFVLQPLSEKPALPEKEKDERPVFIKIELV
jgi:hypothetical protein